MKSQTIIHSGIRFLSLSEVYPQYPHHLGVLHDLVSDLFDPADVDEDDFVDMILALRPDL
jgi:hypothetical protein